LRIHAIRKKYPALCFGELILVDCGSAAVAAYLRVQGNERVLVIQNLSPARQELA
jgi:hypothetical protein